MTRHARVAAGPVWSRIVAGAAVTAGVWLALPGVALAQTPSSLPCQPPITTCPSGAPPGSTSPTPATSPTPPPATPAPSPTPQPSTEPPLVGPVEPLPSTAPGTVAPAPSIATSAPASPSASAAPSGFRLASGRVPLGTAFATITVGLLALPLALTVLASRLSPTTDVPLGGVMGQRPRTRLYAGLGFLAAAGLTALVGWLKISDEPLLNFQVPLLASAGLAVVLLSVVGGSLLVADQLRGDDRRLDDLEEAVRALAAALAPAIEAPPRTTPPDPD